MVRVEKNGALILSDGRAVLLEGIRLPQADNSPRYIVDQAMAELTQMALAFVTSRPFVTSNIIGATTMEQLKTCIDSVNVTITPELEAKIDAIHQVHMNPAP